MRVVRNFEAGLSDLEKLVEFIESPFLAVLKEHLPVHGMRTKPSLAEPAALLAVGAATVIYGADRAADRELAHHWDALPSHFAAAGLRVPTRKPLRSQHFRDYRDGVLGGGLPEEFKEAARDRFAGLAVDLGLFCEEEPPWDRPQLTQAVHADGTKMAAASKVGAGKESRATTGAPRVVTDADRWTNGQGYTFCVLAARGPEARRRVVLDVVHAPRSSEMAAVVPAAVALRGRLGDRFRCFIYDGAMEGMHHRALREAGLMTVNKPKGIRRVDQWRRFRNSRLGEDANLFHLGVGCTEAHLLTLAARMACDVEADATGELYRRRVLEVADVRRLPATGGGFRWEADLVIRCPHGDHVVTVDPNATLKATTVRTSRRRPERPVDRGTTIANLAQEFRLVQLNDEEYFSELYGLRNDSESGNNMIKFVYLLCRAKSFTARRAETDLWLYALLANTFVWRERRTVTGRGWATTSRRG